MSEISPVAIETQPAVREEEDDPMLREYLKAFPADHQTVQALRNENARLHELLLSQYWKYNSHKHLLEEIQQGLGYLRLRCPCIYCYPLQRGKREGYLSENKCKYRTAVLHHMAHAGLTFHIPHHPYVASQEGVPVLSTEPGFDPATACKHLSRVSNIDAHIVFYRPDAFDFVFGRSLWAARTVIGNTETRKLDLFRASLVARRGREMGSDFLGRF